MMSQDNECMGEAVETSEECDNDQISLNSYSSNEESISNVSYTLFHLF